MLNIIVKHADAPSLLVPKTLLSLRGNQICLFKVHSKLLAYSRLKILPHYYPAVLRKCCSTVSSPSTMRQLGRSPVSVARSILQMLLPVSMAPSARAHQVQTRRHCLPSSSRHCASVPIGHVTQAPAASAHTPPRAQPIEAAALCCCCMQQTVSQSVCRAPSVRQHLS